MPARVEPGRRDARVRTYNPPTGGGSVANAEDRGSVGQFWKIWRASNEPFLKKAGLVVKNQFIKVRTLKDCCGNYGEPGC